MPRKNLTLKLTSRGKGTTNETSTLKGHTARPYGCCSGMSPSQNKAPQTLNLKPLTRANMKNGPKGHDWANYVHAWVLRLRDVLSTSV